MRPAKSRSWFTRLTKSTARASGQPASFLLALAVVVAWMVTGPVFERSNTWQLVINTGMDFEELEEHELDEIRDSHVRPAAAARRGKRRGIEDTGTPRV